MGYGGVVAVTAGVFAVCGVLLLFVAKDPLLKKLCTFFTDKKDKNAYKEIKNDKKAYQENEKGIYRIIERRELN